MISDEGSALDVVSFVPPRLLLQRVSYYVDWLENFAELARGG